MSEDTNEYGPDVLMGACIQAAAAILVATNREAAKEPAAVALLAAQIRDEALMQM